MKILKVRTQFATNSSSTHSLLFLDQSTPTTELSEFGWEFFTAANKESKENYFALTMFTALRDSVGVDAAKVILRDLLQRNVENVISNGYIDHQSMYVMPMSWDGKAPDLEFAREFRDFLLQDNIVILGGNDNAEQSHPLGSGFTLPMELDGGMSAFVARKDPLGFWTLYNRGSGAKTRFMFPVSPGKGKEVECPQCDGGREYPYHNCETCHGDSVTVAREKPHYYASPEHSTYPELIDVKITDFCATGCEYCYQGSTVEGKHAKSMHRTISACADMKVFEVAIGGGEPLSHPNFVSILQQFRRSGIVPNFSTRNTSWLENPEKAKEIMNLCGSWAFSADSDDDLHEIEKEVSYRGYEPPSIHVVVGATSRWEFQKIIEFCKEHYWHVVLLGYKTTGRGKDVTPKNDWSWLDVLKKAKGDQYMKVSIDTALLAKHSDELKKEKIAEAFLERREGRFSMYIDAVANTYGPSSYCDPEEMIDIPDGRSFPEAIRNSFAEWAAQGIG